MLKSTVIRFRRPKYFLSAILLIAILTALFSYCLHERTSQNLASKCEDVALLHDQITRYKARIVDLEKTLSNQISTHTANTDTPLRQEAIDFESNKMEPDDKIKRQYEIYSFDDAKNAYAKAALNPISRDNAQIEILTYFNEKGLYGASSDCREALCKVTLDVNDLQKLDDIITQYRSHLRWAKNVVFNVTPSGDTAQIEMYFVRD